MSSALTSQWRLGIWLFAAVLPSLSTSNESTGDDARILENTALNHVGCSVDVSGNYISEIGVKLKITQTDCSLFVEPPGKVVGVVIGKQISLAGQQGHIVGGGKMIKEIMFQNNAAWTKQWTEHDSSAWPAPSTTVKPGAAGTSAEDPCSTGATSSGPATASSTSPPAAVSTSFPWWAVGTGIAIAGASAIAGGVAAGLTHEKTANAPRAAKTSNLTKAADIRFMSSANRLRAANEAPSNQAAKNAVQPRVLASPMVVLCVLAVASFCCVLMLAGVIFAARRMRSSKASRSFTAFRSDSQDSALAEEDELEEEDRNAEVSLLATEPEDA